MRILFTGGGTGGHIFPLIAIIREIRKLYPRKDLEFFYIGPEDEFGSILLSQEDVRVKTISTGKIRRYLSFQNIVDVLFKIPLGVIQAFYHLAKIDPQLVFSKGGPGSLPVTLCAMIFRIPIFLHESDVIPGMANKFTSRFASEIFVSFPRTEYYPLKKMILIGNPIRREILESSKEEARKMFRK